MTQALGVLFGLDDRFTSSNRPAVREVFRIRQDPFAWHDGTHDADLIVKWVPEMRSRGTLSL